MLTKKSSKKAILAAWLEALRGQSEVKYKQGTGALREVQGGKKKDTFCCLGVLCDLAVKAGVVGQEDPEARDSNLYSYGGETGLLPQEVMDWAGMRGTSGEFEEDGATIELTVINDHGASFKKIADVIEKNKKAIFVKGVRL